MFRLYRKPWGPHGYPTPRAIHLSGNKNGSCRRTFPPIEFEHIHTTITPRGVKAFLAIQLDPPCEIGLSFNPSYLPTIKRLSCLRIQLQSARLSDRIHQDCHHRLGEFMRKFIVLVSLIGLICGCARTTPVTPLGRDLYTVSGLYSQDALTAANKYCDSLGKKILVRYTSGSTWSSVMFRCLSPQDPEYPRPAEPKH